MTTSARVRSRNLFQAIVTVLWNAYWDAARDYGTPAGEQLNTLDFVALASKKAHDCADHAPAGR